MLCSLEGVMGSGKSLTAATLAKLDHDNGRQIISNNQYKFPYTKFDTAYFIEHMVNADEELTNVTFVLDEAYLFLDSRNSQTKLTKLFTYFIAQTRKRNVDMYICIHHIDTVDKRLRRAFDVRGTCRYRPEKPCRKCQGEGSKDGEICVGTPKNLGCLGYGVNGYATVSFFDMRTSNRRKLKIHGPTFWGNYDTLELVAPTGKALNINPDDI